MSSFKKYYILFLLSLNFVFLTAVNKTFANTETFQETTQLSHNDDLYLTLSVDDDGSMIFYQCAMADLESFISANINDLNLLHDFYLDEDTCVSVFKTIDNEEFVIDQHSLISAMSYFELGELTAEKTDEYHQFFTDFKHEFSRNVDISHQSVAYSSISMVIIDILVRRKIISPLSLSQFFKNFYTVLSVTAYISGIMLVNDFFRNKGDKLINDYENKVQNLFDESTIKNIEGKEILDSTLFSDYGYAEPQIHSSRQIYLLGNYLNELITKHSNLIDSANSQDQNQKLIDSYCTIQVVDEKTQEPNSKQIKCNPLKEALTSS